VRRAQRVDDMCCVRGSGSQESQAHLLLKFVLIPDPQAGKYSMHLAGCLLYFAPRNWGYGRWRVVQHLVLVNRSMVNV
jgi:hypothetical protein